MANATDGEFYCKVSDKGAVSLYGMRRFPATYYADEWETLEKLMPKIKAFIKKHKSELKDKASGGHGPEGAERL